MFTVCKCQSQVSQQTNIRPCVLDNQLLLLQNIDSNDTRNVGNGKYILRLELKKINSFFRVRVASPKLWSLPISRGKMHHCTTI